MSAGKIFFHQMMVFETRRHAIILKETSLNTMSTIIIW